MSLDVTRVYGTFDPGNSAQAAALAAYTGTPYTPVSGSAIPAATADMYLGTRFPCVDYAGFGISAIAAPFGQGYAIWEKEVTPGVFIVLHYETTPFAGAGAFFDPPGGATHGRIAFQNRIAAPGSFTSSLVWKINAPGQFIFPVGAPIDPSFPATLTKTVITGQQPDNDFENVRVSGSVPEFSSTTLLGAGATFAPTIAPGSDSYDPVNNPGPGFDATGFVSVYVIVNASHISATDGLKIQFSNDAFVTVSQEFSFTYAATDVGLGRRYLVPANAGEQFRIRYTNGGTAQTAFSIRTELAITQVQPMSDDIGRGTLLVSPGLRISQVFKRVPFHLTFTAITVDTLLFTVTATKIAYITDFQVTLSNTSLLAGAQLIVRDGTTAAGTTKIPFLTEPATNQGNASVTHNHALADPIAMTAGIFLDFTAGTATCSGFIRGYEE